MTGRLRSLARWFGRSGVSPAELQRRSAAFRVMYERFREILALNDSVLETIAEIEDRLAGRPFSLVAMQRRVRRATMDVFVMAKNLNLLTSGRYLALYEALHEIDAEIEAETVGLDAVATGPEVLPLETVRADQAQLAGTKMANLGEVALGAGLRIPPGFVVTTVAVSRFLSHAGLWERCERLQELLELEGEAALGEACNEVTAAIRAAAPPAEFASRLRQAFAAAFSTSGARVAVRSSAVGEDSAGTSHAGLYETCLDVGIDGLLDAYRAVVASAFSPTAVAYRYERGLSPRDAAMAVGVVEMVRPRCAGIMYSRPPDDPEADAVMISVTAGIAAAVAAGEAGAEVVMVVPGRESGAVSSLLAPAEIAALVRSARTLEEHFGAPQDVEWAVEDDGRVTILQSRPVVSFVAADAEPAVTGREALLAGGFAACAGVGSGPVVPVTGEPDLVGFPDGGVLVARHSSPTFARVMRRCAAIVTDVGAPTGHMASLAREFGVPAIVGLPAATTTLRAGQFVTVDAGSCRVFEGAMLTHERGRRERRPADETPAHAGLRRLARLVTPLGLTDPAAPGFEAANCRSLHDVTRFVHEKAYGVMFHYGDAAREDRQHSFKLDARLPIVVRVFDVGGGVTVQRGGGGRLKPTEIASAPFAALLRGMLEPRIRWDLPRPVSVRGFLSVLGESMAGPPAEVLQVGRLSYAIVSDRYLNFSTKAGYHFQTVDTYCGLSQNKNYIHFRFAGGAADEARRSRRIAFVSAVLRALDFTVVTRGDLLQARLDKYPFATVERRLVDLGHLTMCARQLDMLMDDDASPDYFASAFLAGEWEKF